MNSRFLDDEDNRDGIIFSCNESVNDGINGSDYGTHIGYINNDNDKRSVNHVDNCNETDSNNKVMVILLFILLLILR